MRRFLVLSAILSFAAVPVHADLSKAQISGRVTDEQGAMLPGVSLAITNEATGVSREVTSSAEGAVLGFAARAGHVPGGGADSPGSGAWIAPAWSCRSGRP